MDGTFSDNWPAFGYRLPADTNVGNQSNTPNSLSFNCYAYLCFYLSYLLKLDSVQRKKIFFFIIMSNVFVFLYSSTLRDSKAKTQTYVTKSTLPIIIKF